MKNNLENQDIKTDKPLAMSYEALKAERDALAVENAALKARAVTVPAKVYVKDMRCNVVRWAQVIDALSDAGVAFVRDDGELIAGTRETPATDAALAAIEARGVVKFAEATIAIGEQEKEESIIYAGKQAMLFAEQLREGK